MVFRQSDSPVINRTIKSLEKELYLRVVERLFIYHHVKKAIRKSQYATKLKSVKFFPLSFLLQTKLRLLSLKRCCAVLSNIYRHRDEGETHKNSREHLITNKTNKEKFKRSAVRNGDVNNHISEHRPLTNHNIVWDFTRCLTFSMN